MSHKKCMRLLTLLMILITALTFASAYIPAPASAQTTYPWPMFQHDPAHTGYTQSPAPDTFVVGWKYETGGAVKSSPAVVDGKVYIGSDDKNIYCLDATSGNLVWKYTTTGVISHSSPAVVDGKVYIGSGDNNIYCLDSTSGNLVWKYTTGNIVISSPCVIDGKVYIGSNDKNIYCLDAATGTLVWKYSTGDLIAQSSPAVVGGRVYIGSHDNNVYCLDATSGTLAWKYLTGSTISSSPAVVDGNVYIGSTIPDSNFYCLDAATGTLLWKSLFCRDFDPGVLGAPAFAYGNVYAGIYLEPTCIEATTGKRVWSFKTGFTIYSSPAIADGKVYIGSTDRYFYCFDAESGDLLQSYLTGAAIIMSSPAIADGKIYIGSNDFSVYCFVEGMPTVQTTISCVVSPTSVTLGNSLTIRGSISPAVSGATVTLTYTKPDATTTTRTVTSGADGSFTDIYTPDAAGSWSVKSRWLGDAGHEGSTSSVSSFTVTMELEPTEPEPTEPEPTEPEPTEPEPTEPEPAEPTEAPLITTEMAIIVAAVIVAVIGVVAYWVLRKRK